MNWFHSIAISVLSGIVGLLLAGFIANACVSWYRVSSFEGKAGFFVVFLALVGGLAGAIIGLATARVVAASIDPSFLKGLGLALGVVVTLAAIATLLCRLAKQ